VYGVGAFVVGVGTVLADTTLELGLTVGVFGFLAATLQEPVYKVAN
jgi:hypothetical protein